MTKKQAHSVMVVPVMGGQWVLMADEDAARPWLRFLAWAGVPVVLTPNGSHSFTLTGREDLTGKRDDALGAVLVRIGALRVQLAALPEAEQARVVKILALGCELAELQVKEQAPGM